MSGFLGICGDCGKLRPLNSVSLCRTCDDHAEAFLKGAARHGSYKEGIREMMLDRLGAGTENVD